MDRPFLRLNNLYQAVLRAVRWAEELASGVKTLAEKLCKANRHQCNEPPPALRI